MAEPKEVVDVARLQRSALAVAVVASVAAVPAAVAAQGRPTRPAVYLVGGAAQSINPTKAMLADHFNLGGYGFGSGRVANAVGVKGVTDVVAGREADGILGDGVHTRAFAVSDGRATLVLTQIETQGYFDAYKQGPFGENEIRHDAAAKIAKLSGDAHTRGAHTAPAPTAAEILVDSDHSHGGPDTAGVWGGVPTSYLKLVHDRTVAAIVAAWRAMRPATLTYGVAHAGVNGEAAYPPSDAKTSHADWLLHNQFAYDPANQAMDDEVRVLQARDPRTHRVLDTYVNFSAHPTVLGSSNTKVTADYVGRLDDQLERTYGGFAMDQVATLGREQPERTGCPSDPKANDADPRAALCMLDSYAGRVVVKVKEALAVARPMTGAPVVAMNSYLLNDVTTSGVLAGAEYAGTVIGAPAARAANAPWYTGTVLGTSYFVGRIGSLLVTGGPGEMYAQIWQKVKSTVVADRKSGITGVMNIGTAGDFLGYIIAPLSAYPEPAYSSVANHNTDCDGVPDPVGYGCPDPIGNDNYFFNVSHTFGERLTCDFLRGAGDVLARDAQKYWATYSLCPSFANDLALPPGADTQFPPQPDLSAVMPHM